MFSKFNYYNIEHNYQLYNYSFMQTTKSLFCLRKHAFENNTISVTNNCGLSYLVHLSLKHRTHCPHCHLLHVHYQNLEHTIKQLQSNLSERSPLKAANLCFAASWKFPNLGICSYFAIYSSVNLPNAVIFFFFFISPCWLFKTCLTVYNWQN